MKKILFVLAALTVIAILVGCTTPSDDVTPTDPGDKIVGTEDDAIAEDMSNIADDFNLDDIESLDEELAAIEDLQLE